MSSLDGVRGGQMHPRERQPRAEQRRRRHGERVVLVVVGPETKEGRRPLQRPARPGLRAGGEAGAAPAATVVVGGARVAEQAELLEQLRQRRGHGQQLGAQLLGDAALAQQLLGLLRHAARRLARLERPLSLRPGGDTLAPWHRQAHQAEARGELDHRWYVFLRLRLLLTL